MANKGAKEAGAIFIEPSLREYWGREAHSSNNEQSTQSFFWFMYIYYWNIVGLQCFRYTARWFSYASTHIIFEIYFPSSASSTRLSRAMLGGNSHCPVLYQMGAPQRDIQGISLNQCQARRLCGFGYCLGLGEKSFPLIVLGNSPTGYTPPWIYLMVAEINNG